MPRLVCSKQRPRSGLHENGPALQRWKRVEKEIEAREAGGRNPRTCRPLRGFVVILGLLFPAINRWAIVVRPLRGLEGINAVGGPSLANGFCNCYYFRLFARINK